MPKLMSEDVSVDPESPPAGGSVASGKVSRDGREMVARLADGRDLLRWSVWDVCCAVAADDLGEVKGVSLGDGCRAAILSGRRGVDRRSLVMFVPLVIISLMYVMYDLDAGLWSAVIAMGVTATVAVHVLASGRDHKEWLAIFDWGLVIGNQRTFAVLPWKKIDRVRVDSDVNQGMRQTRILVEEPGDAAHEFVHSALIRTPPAKRLEAAATVLQAALPAILQNRSADSHEQATPTMPPNHSVAS